MNNGGNLFENSNVEMTDCSLNKVNSDHVDFMMSINTQCMCVCVCKDGQGLAFP